MYIHELFYTHIDEGSLIELANSLVYPERIHRGIEWTSVFETFFVCVFFVVGKFSNFYTVKYGRVQYSTGIYLVPRYYSVV